MAAAPHESDSAGTVVVGAHRIATRVKSEPETKTLAAETMTSRKALKKLIRERQDADDAVIEAEGALSAASRRTDRRQKIFAQRLAAAHATPRQKGEKSPAYLFVFDNRSASKTLPRARDERMEALLKMKGRIGDVRKAGADTPKLAVDFLKAVDQEAVAFDHVHEVQQAFVEAREAEETAKRNTVVAVRAMANAVQAKFAAEPSVAREVLGYGDAAATRRKNVATQKKAAMSVAPADK